MELDQTNCIHDCTAGEVHQCSRFCNIQPVFGNMFQCMSSGQTHICDQNCTQRVVYDNVSTICRLSRKVFPLSQEELAARSSSRKRLSGDAETFGGSAKRQFGTPPPPSNQNAVPNVFQQTSPFGQQSSPFAQQSSPFGQLPQPNFPSFAGSPGLQQQQQPFGQQQPFVFGQQPSFS